MYRFDNEIIFEERMPNNRAQSDPAAVVIEKDSNACTIWCLFLENFWLYHRTTVEDYEEERQQPSMKAWHIVKYLNSDTSSFINKVTPPLRLIEHVGLQGQDRGHYKVRSRPFQGDNALQLLWRRLGLSPGALSEEAEEE